MYFQDPCVCDQQVVFVQNDALWEVSLSGGRAYRLTQPMPGMQGPRLSPDKDCIAFVAHKDLYVMPAWGGQERRLTFWGAPMTMLGWRDRQTIQVASCADSPFRQRKIYDIDVHTGHSQELLLGPCEFFSADPAGSGGCVIQRHGYGYTSWKRYRGGTAAELWVKTKADTAFSRILSEQNHNLLRPFWWHHLGQDRIVFLSDHEGVGNIYSCTLGGTDLRQHTYHTDFYARQTHMNSQESCIVYSCAGDIWVCDLSAGGARKLEIAFAMGAVDRTRVACPAHEYVHSFMPSNDGKRLLLTTRGRAFHLTQQKGPCVQLGQTDGVRYRTIEYDSRGRAMVLCDDGLTQRVEWFHGTPTAQTDVLATQPLIGSAAKAPAECDAQAEGSSKASQDQCVPCQKDPNHDQKQTASHKCSGLSLPVWGDIGVTAHVQVPGVCGRVVDFVANPVNDSWAFMNHRHELWIAGADTGSFPEVPLVQAALIGHTNGHGVERQDDNDHACVVWDDDHPAVVPVKAVYADGWVHVDTSPRGPVTGYSWSVCGRFLAYARMCRSRGASLRIYDAVTGHVRVVQDSSFCNSDPVFDPEGKYLYFLSARTFSPGWDPLHMTMTCPLPVRPYALVLAADQPCPLVGPLIQAGHSDADSRDDVSSFATVSASAVTHGEQENTPQNAVDEASVHTQDGHEETKKDKDKDKKTSAEVRIDWAGLGRRLVAVPMAARDYRGLLACKGQVLCFAGPSEGGAEEDWRGQRDATGAGSTSSVQRGEGGGDKTGCDLWSYDWHAVKEERLATGVQGWSLSGNGQWLLMQVHKRLRMVKAGAKVDDTPDTSVHGGGWVNWGRVDLRVCPRQEWHHMFDEAWRLQKEHFWTPTMGQVDWQHVRAKYKPLVDRVSTQEELWAVIADMQGELGTSHAYVYGHSQPVPSCEQPCFLGGRWAWDSSVQGYRLRHVVQDDPWHPSPLQRAGLGMQAGDVLWAVAGQRLTQDFSPEQAFLGRAGQAVPVVISRGSCLDGGKLDSQAELLAVQPTLPSQTLPAHACDDKLSSAQDKTLTLAMQTHVVVPVAGAMAKRALYRQWVQSCRQWVHDHSGGQVGYVHIPDMGPWGFGEFLRGYMTEFDRPGLIIDARYNGGGNISYLILDFLTRKRLGYDRSRHQGIMPYPSDAPRGPMAALVNEYTGSDGDIFTQSFKALQLGPVIGKRTWGGVVGIWPRYGLLDGTMTSSPEYAFWFHDAGWTVENKGVDPDVVVDIHPEEYAAGVDAQLQRGLDHVMQQVRDHAPRIADQMTPPPEPILRA